VSDRPISPCGWFSPHHVALCLDIMSCHFADSLDDIYIYIHIYTYIYYIYIYIYTYIYTYTYIHIHIHIYIHIYMPLYLSLWDIYHYAIMNCVPYYVVYPNIVRSTYPSYAYHIPILCCISTVFHLLAKFLHFCTLPLDSALSLTGLRFGNNTLPKINSSTLPWIGGWKITFH